MMTVSIFFSPLVNWFSVTVLMISAPLGVRSTVLPFTVMNRSPSAPNSESQIL